MISANDYFGPTGTFISGVAPIRGKTSKRCVRVHRLERPIIYTSQRETLPPMLLTTHTSAPAVQRLFGKPPSEAIVAANVLTET